MKKAIAIICLITGTLVMFIQWGAHLGSHHPPQWATSGVSGMLIFIGIIILGIDMKSKSRRNDRAVK